MIVDMYILKFKKKMNKNLTSLCGIDWAGRGTVVVTTAAVVTAVGSGVITLTCVVAVAVAVTGTVAATATAGLYWVCYNIQWYNI